MQFSIWDYLKERAKKATLAGVAEALEELEDGDSEASHQAAADRLRARLGGQAVRQLPAPESVTTEEPAGMVPVPDGTEAKPPPATVNGRSKAPTPTARSRGFGEGLEPTPPERPALTQTPAPAKKPDPFEERLNGAIPSPAPRATPPAQERRGPSRNGHGPALPEFDPPPRAFEPPAAEPEAPERRKRGRPRKDEA